MTCDNGLLGMGSCYLAYSKAVHGVGFSFTLGGFKVTFKHGYGVSDADGIAIGYPLLRDFPMFKTVFCHAYLTLRANAHGRSAVIGGWLDEAEQKYCLDITTVFNDLGAAIRLAVQNRQKCVWDFDANKPIWLDPPEGESCS